MRKGSKHTEKARKNLSIGQIGRKPFSEEHRKNLSIAHKGFKYSEESKKLMSIAKLGEKNSMFGKEVSKKTRKKLSIVCSGEKNGFYGKKHTKKAKKLMGGIHKGKHHSPKTEFKKGLIPWNKELKGFMVGEKNGMWLGGKSFEPYGLEFNNRFRKLIQERDGCCLLCNVLIKDLRLLKRRIHIHHIDYNKLITLPQNCISLCIKCHNGIVHNKETKTKREHWTKFFQSLLSERYDYKYSEDGEIILELNK